MYCSIRASRPIVISTEVDFFFMNLNMNTYPPHDVIAQPNNEFSPSICPDSAHKVKNKPTALLAELIVFFFRFKKEAKKFLQQALGLCMQYAAYALIECNDRVHCALAFIRILFIIHSEYIHHRIIMSLSTPLTVSSVSFSLREKNKYQSDFIHRQQVVARSEATSKLS